VGGNPSYLELLGRVRETALEAYAHQDLPFEKLVAEFQTTRDLNQTPLFNVVFTLQNTPVQDLKLPGLVWHFVGDGGTTSKFELGMNFIDLGGELRGVIEYSTDLFEQETIDEMIQRYLNLLQSVVANPLIHLDELEILLPEEDYVLKQEILINDLMQSFAF
jgi:aspartate racemase